VYPYPGVLTGSYPRIKSVDPQMCVCVYICGWFLYMSLSLSLSVCVCVCVCVCVPFSVVWFLMLGFNSSIPEPALLDEKALLLLMLY
jgi:hypothetical protein